MNRISIITPTLSSRQAWRKLQDRWYQGSDIERIYAEDDNRNAFDATRLMLDYVHTPYMVFAGDDDFHVPAQLHRMAGFLDVRPDVVGVYGEGILCQLQDWQLGWTADYAEGMRIERAFSLVRTETFHKAMTNVPQPVPYRRGRDVMNSQNLAFREGMEAQGPFVRYPIQDLQLFHCHHTGRGELETTEAWFKTMAEKCGGGWLASWLPSRACSRRNLERTRSPHHDEFMKFKQVVEQFAFEYEPEYIEELSID